MRISSPIWKVTIIDSERGWGQKVLEVNLYDDENEARAAAAEVNKHNKSQSAPDYYICASVSQVA